MYHSKRGRVHKDRFDPSRRVAISQGGVCALRNLAHFLYLLRTELDVQRAKILVQILMSAMMSMRAAFLLIFTFSYLDITRARDRDDVWSLREKPGERNLSRRGIVLRSYLLDFLHDLEDIREVLLRVPRDAAPEIAFFKVIRARLRLGRPQRRGTNVGRRDVHICQSAGPSRGANTQRRLHRAHARLV